MKISVLIFGLLLNGWVAVFPALAEENISAGLSPDFQLQTADGSDVALFSPPVLGRWHLH